MNARLTPQKTARRQIHDAFAWDDLNTILAVARGGSLSAAARALGVNHSTVSRRLAALEKATGHTLFRGLPRGNSPTAAGEELIRAATRMEAEVLRLGKVLGSRQIDLTGTVRLTAPDDVASVLLVEPLARFRALHPSVGLEMISENRMLNLSRREADIALRCTSEPPEFLIGRRVARLGATVYVSRAFLQRSGRDQIAPGNFAEQPWIGWEEESPPNVLDSWLVETCPPEAIVYRSNSVPHQFAAAQAGLGLAVLPCYLGDTSDQLVRLLPPQERLATDLWLLTHPDLRDTPRIAALTDLLFSDLRELIPRLAGEAA